MYCDKMRQCIRFVPFLAIVFANQAVAQESPTLAPDRVIVTGSPIPSTIFDSARPVTVLEQPELQRKLQATLGETLANEPGVTGTQYGAGASRPVIRGLDANRVRVLADGLGVFDVSNTSPDHAVSIEPLGAGRIEIVRGPAALLYGTNAVGGLVNVTSNRIPNAPIGTPLSGAVDFSFGSAGNARSGAALLEGGLRGFNYHLDASYREADDYDIPGFKRSAALRAASPLPDGESEIRGTLPDSGYSTKQIAGGGSYTWSAGYFGVGISAYHTLYGVPGFEEGVKIKLNQRRFDLSGRFDHPLPFLKSIDYKFGYAEYHHQEINDEGVGTLFKNKGYEGRVELRNAKVGGFEGVIGYQIQRGNFAAIGEEAFQQPTRTLNQAIFLFQEYAFKPFRFEVGARVEHQFVRTAGVADLPALDPNSFVDLDALASTPATRRFTTFSAAASLVWSRDDISAALSVSHTARLATGQELFAFGPHLATAQYELGTVNAGPEKSLAVDLTLRKRAGMVTSSVSAFYYRFDNYIDLIDTGLDFVSLTLANGTASRRLVPRANPAVGIPSDATLEDQIRAFRFTGVPAEFRGFEAEAKIHLLGPVKAAGAEPTKARVVAAGESGKAGPASVAEPNQSDLFLDLRVDYTRAGNRATGGALPRIPPLRIGLGLAYTNARASARVDFRRVFRQDRVDLFETPTPAYNDVSASVQYLLVTGPVQWSIFLKGNNLANAEERNHVSFLKDVTPLPGRSVTAGFRATF